MHSGWCCRKSSLVHSVKKQQTFNNTFHLQFSPWISAASPHSVCLYLGSHRSRSTLRHSSLAQFSPLFALVGSERCQCSRSPLQPSGKGNMNKPVWLNQLSLLPLQLKNLFKETRVEDVVWWHWWDTNCVLICWFTCRPDILSLDALVKLMIRQFTIIPAVAVQMDTPWMNSAGKILLESEARNTVHVATGKCGLAMSWREIVFQGDRHVPLLFLYLRVD